MRKNKLTIVLSVALAIVVVAGISAYAASNYGTSSDPLISLSYLNDTLTPKIMKDVQTEIDKAVSEIDGSFTVVTLSNGQTIKGGVGCEMLLRVGSAKVSAADSPGLVNVSDGDTIDNGAALTANKLYMVSIEGHGITATAATVKLLVCGSYTIA